MPVHDLHWVVEQGGPEATARPGTARTTPRRGTPGSPRRSPTASCGTSPCTATGPGRGPPPEARRRRAAYREDERERRRRRAGLYRDLAGRRVPAPGGRRSWTARSARTCWPGVLQSLGDLPPGPSPPRARRHRPRAPPGLHAGAGRPRQRRGRRDQRPAADARGAQGARCPAVLWLHSSTPGQDADHHPRHQRRRRSRWARRSCGAGYVVLAPDAYWHGDRAGTGPAGAVETGRAEQESLLKLHLWMGRTLWGMFVRDDQIALDYLCSRPEVDAAAHRRHRHEHGQHARLVAGRRGRARRGHGRRGLPDPLPEPDRPRRSSRQHGVYYFVQRPAAALRHRGRAGPDRPAPLPGPHRRPGRRLPGRRHPGAGAAGRAPSTAPSGAGDRFRNVLYPDVGHTYTPAMRAEMLAWFDRWLT